MQTPAADLFLRKIAETSKKQDKKKNKNKQEAMYNLQIVMKIPVHQKSSGTYSGRLRLSGVIESKGSKGLPRPLGMLRDDESSRSALAQRVALTREKE